MTVGLLGIVSLALLAVWLLGGFVLRLGGLMLVVAGVFGLILGEGPGAILVSATGGLLWLAGHWHYALRHQRYKSALARHLFCRWAPAWLDPTRGWALGVRPERLDRDAGRGRVDRES